MLARNRGGWQVVGPFLLLFHFALPFLLLLWKRNKENVGRLVMIGFWILAVRWIDILLQVKPAFSPGQFSVHWMDFALLLGIGGIWMAFFAWQLAGAPLLPVRDPRVVRKLGAAEAH